MQLLEVMKRVELFQDLDDTQLKRLGSISKEAVYKAGTTIFSQGDVGDKMFIIGKGQVEVVVQDSQGESYPAVYLGPGQVVGEMALIDQGTRSASVLAALDDTVVYSIPSEDFTALCRQDTAIGYLMMRNMAQDLSFKLRHINEELTGS